jgi:hypothetical protein
MTVAAKSLRTRFTDRLRVASGRKVAAGVAAAMVATGSFAGCTSAQLQGQASSYLIVENLQCANGADPEKLANTCDSDVLTFVKKQVNGQQVLVPTIFEDPGVVTFGLGMKNPSNLPSPSNFITLNRYRVNFVRADGRNTPGVDVPYPFDGAFTATVNKESGVAATLALVRIQAKQENPLKPLVGSGGALAISTLAEITFYGQDQAGREVSATGRIGVTFSDWGDPE